MKPSKEQDNAKISLRDKRGQILEFFSLRKESETRKEFQRSERMKRGDQQRKDRFFK